MLSGIMSLGRHWKVLTLILALPVLLWLLAFAGYLLLYIIGGLYYAIVLLWAFLTLVVLK